MTKGIRLNWIPFFVGKFLEVNMMNEWLELIERNEEQIINTGIEAYKEAIENTQLRYIVEINTNGEITTWYDIAGGNSFHMSTYNGKSIELLHFCMRDMEFDPSDETVEQKLRDKGLWNLYLEERERQDAEDYYGAEIVLCNSSDKKLRECLEECENSWCDNVQEIK